MTYSQAIEEAMTYWGENWWRCCCVIPDGPTYSACYRVVWVTPKLGATRPH